VNAQLALTLLLAVTLVLQAVLPRLRLLIVTFGAGLAALVSTLLGIATAPALLREVPWDVLVILVGLGLVSELFVSSRVFDVLAVSAGRWSQADPRRLTALFAVGMYAVSGLVNNLTALLLVLPVLDAVAAAWLDGVCAPPLQTEAVERALLGAKKVVLVGLETRFMDALLPRLPDVRFALLQHGTFDVDWERVLANYGGRLTPLDFDRFQAWAGASSALLTFAYGVHGASTHVVPSWLRVTGEDVRTQFRSLVAWDVLAAPMWVYPRWLVEVPKGAFTRVIA
jgi:hypothetical protein